MSVLVDQHNEDIREPALGDIPITLRTLPGLPVLALIRIYQRMISPALPAACRFYPSCSHYAYQAIAKYGLLKGGLMGAKRLLRCHPLNPGGFDPVP
ncbi:MAG: membrane protein insertion efficiency factor YidD [Anaerolineales bacterium]|nr:membrane protein insertion efficiency factor YidD [Anaerolineales bacterium]